MPNTTFKKSKRRYIYVTTAILFIVTVASIFLCISYIRELQSLISLNTLQVQKSSSFLEISIVTAILIVLMLLSFLTYFSVSQISYKNKLQTLAYIDPITKGWNSNWFKTQITFILKGNESQKFVLILLDIDKFKVLNDAFGHTKGNELLAYIYQCIKSQQLEKELFCRLESDCFLMLMKWNSNHEIQERLEKLSIQINNFSVALEQKYFISMSCGISQIDNAEEDLFIFIDRCEVALRYSTKTIGRTRFLRSAFYNEFDKTRLLEEKKIENKMVKALESGQFEVYLQPKFDIESNKAAGAEALVRWQDPERGLIMPNDFISLFEKNGFILKLDLFVFEKVCRILRSWIDAGAEPVPISVNLSRTYLDSLAFLDNLECIRSQYNVPSQYIEFELTESIVYENMGLLLTIINKVHALGYTCSIDDFGSGYSSLNLLRNVPVDTLKLDRGFFMETEESQERGNAVITSVIDLARKLNMKTVSEGVENVVQVNFLRNAQCDLVQGYVFSKPVPISEFEKEVFGLVLSEKRILPNIDPSMTEGVFLMHDATDFEQSLPLA